MDIPASLLNDLDCVPRDRPVGLLMRHSARYPIVDPADTFIIGLTEEGVRMAEELGTLIGKVFSPGRLLSAPVGRCIDTAEAIARGAGWPAQAGTDHRLSHPHIEPALRLFEKGEVNGVLPAPVRAALDLLLDNPGDPRLDIMVTHDTVVGTVAGCLLHAPVSGEHWPKFLEGMFVWRVEDKVYARWRGTETVLAKL